MINFNVGGWGGVGGGAGGGVGGGPARIGSVTMLAPFTPGLAIGCDISFSVC